MQKVGTQRPIGTFVDGIAFKDKLGNLRVYTDITV